MFWTNYHSHSQYCDGSLPIEDHIQEAIQRNFIALGISSHAPVFFENVWSMKSNQVINYLNEINTLAKKYKDQIQIYKSMEFDYIPGKCGPGSSTAKSYNLDYTIGSVHFVGYFENGDPWAVDGSHDHFLRGLEEIYKGDIKKVVNDFFSINREMLTLESPNIIGHFDKIKMYNYHIRHFFSEDEPWYRNEILEFLELVKEKDIIVEVNTRGMYKGYTEEPFPSWWVLEEIRNREIPIQLNSDSHHPNELDGSYSVTAKKLKSIGFETMQVLLDGKWQDVPFNKNGLLIN